MPAIAATKTITPKTVPMSRLERRQHPHTPKAFASIVRIVVGHPPQSVVTLHLRFQRRPESTDLIYSAPIMARKAMPSFVPTTVRASAGLSVPVVLLHVLGFPVPFDIAGTTQWGMNAVRLT